MVKTKKKKEEKEVKESAFKKLLGDSVVESEGTRANVHFRQAAWSAAKRKLDDWERVKNRERMVLIKSGADINTLSDFATELTTRLHHLGEYLKSVQGARDIHFWFIIENVLAIMDKSIFEAVEYPSKPMKIQSPTKTW